MEQYIKKFDELTIYELYDILKLRSQVFVVEQQINCQDLDGYDLITIHIFLKKESEIVAYLRVFPKNTKYKEVSMGRVATLIRKKGIGSELLRTAIDYVFNVLKDDLIRISAQTHAIGFYEKHGFKSQGEIYLDEGTEHIDMYLKKEDYQV